MFHKIIVPLDGSKQAEAAIKPATFLARAFQASLKLVLVEEMPPHLSKEEWELTQDEVLDRNRQHLEDYLRGLAHEVRSEGCSVSFAVLPLGPAAHRILEEVEAERPDLLVITSHGRTGLPRLVMGSVAESLARQSPCPVMIIGHHRYAS
jgi:nucleotide-binding universal stress UspA family protein